MNGQESRSGGGKRERDDPPTLSTSGPKVPRTLSNDDPDGHTVLLWPENSTGSVQFPLDDAWLLFYNYSPYIGEEKEKLASDAEREKIQVPCTEEVWVWLRNYVAAETRAAHALPDASGSSPLSVVCSVDAEPLLALASIAHLLRRDTIGVGALTGGFMCRRPVVENSRRGIAVRCSHLYA